MDFEELKKLSDSKTAEGIYLVTIKKGRISVSDINVVEIKIKSFEKRANSLNGHIFAICGLVLISVLIIVNTFLLKFIPQISFLKGIFPGIAFSVAVFIIFGLITDFFAAGKLKEMKDEFSTEISYLGITPEWLLAQDWIEKKCPTVFNALSKGFPDS